MMMEKIKGTEAYIKNRTDFNYDKAVEQMETGKIPKENPNKLGYSDLYAENWERIFRKDNDQ